MGLTGSSLKFRMGITSVGLMALVIGVVFVYQLKNHYDESIEGYLRNGERFGSFIAAIAGTSLLTFDFTLLDETIQKIAEQEDILSVSIIDKKGKVLREKNKGTDTQRQIDIKQGIVSAGEEAGTVVIVMSVEKVYRMLKNDITVMSFQALLGIVISSWLLIFILNRLVVKPIDAINRTIQEVGKGDLTIELPTGYAKEVRQLAEGFNAVVTNLRETVGQAAQSAENVSNSALKVSDNSRRIAVSAEQEAATTEQTTESMEKIALTISRVVQNTADLVINVNQTSATISEMSSSIEQVGKSTETMAQFYEETSATIEEMLALVEQTARNSGNMTESVRETSHFVENQLSSVEQVARNADGLKTMVVETTATMEEMAATVKEVAKRIEEANDIARGAYTEAQEGGKTIYRSIESLQNIGGTTQGTMEIIRNLGRRSSEIGTIVEVINEIADQTNLLALNAAIEAARAGDAGRGFAVVADEIRKLAERSMGATKEIAEVIRHVQGETQAAINATEKTSHEGKEGMVLAEGSRDMFSKIVSSMRESSEVTEGIARAAAELSRGIEQIMRFVTNMNNATEDVAGTVRRQAEGAGSIRQSLDKMNRMVQEVNSATKEQSIGGKRISEDLERVKSIVNQVNIAVREQVKGARHIVQVIEKMHDMTGNVESAVAEQKRAGETVVKAMEEMGKISEENIMLSRGMVDIAEDTLRQVNVLHGRIGRFKIREKESVSA